MPVLDLDGERTIAPRSALRYRSQKQSSNTDQAVLPDPVALRAHRLRTNTRAQAAHVVPDDLDLDEEEECVPYRRRTVAPAPRQSIPPPARRRQRIHPLFFMGVGLLLTLGLWVGISQAITWGTNEINTIKYGYPRTFQMDALLGHNDSAAHPSHLIATNLHGQILIFEAPGGDPTQARIYVGPQLLGANSDLVPVILHLIDPNRTGHPDLIIDAGDLQSLLINTGSGFRSATAAEQQLLLHGSDS